MISSNRESVLDYILALQRGEIQRYDEVRPSAFLTEPGEPNEELTADAEVEDA